MHACVEHPPRCCNTPDVHMHFDGKLSIEGAALRLPQVDSHTKWLNDVVAHCENNVTIDFPIIADPTREISVKCARPSRLAGPVEALCKLCSVRAACLF